MRTDNNTFTLQSETGSLTFAGAVELFFSASTVRMWTGTGEITLGDDVYYGTGGCGNISPTNESGDLSAQGRQLTLSNVSPQIASLCQMHQSEYKNRMAKEYVIIFGADGNYVTHQCTYVGRMDTFVIEDKGTEGNVLLTLENHLIDLGRAREKRYTQTQLELDNGSEDKGLEYLNGIQNVIITWGTAVFSAPNINSPAKNPYSL